jgi:hypothetical protein
MMRRLSICFCLAAFAPPSRVVFSFLITPPIPSRRGGSATVATPTTNSHYYVSTTTRDDNNNYLHRGRRLLLGLGSLPPNLEALVGDALDKDRKIVVVTGGVLSGIGKGVTASSIGVVSLRGTTYTIKDAKDYAHTLLFDGVFSLNLPSHRFILSQLFRAMGYRVTAIKIDPYLNVDAGTMVRMNVIVRAFFIPHDSFRPSNFVVNR